nr:hypothetical protein [Tanacetum cinerariifolium]
MLSKTDNSLTVAEQTTLETPSNMSPEKKAHFLPEKEAIHLILTGIGDDIYSTVDSCQTAQEMWEAIERLQQEWSRFVTSVKQQHKLDEVSYHKLFDILKQYQNEVNELCAEKLARNANPLALVATAQADRDPYYQSSRTSSNSKNNNVDTTPRYKNDDHSGQFRTQRIVNVAAARDKVGSMYDWLADTDEEVDKQKLEAHYGYMAKIQEVPIADSGTDSEPVEQVQNEAGYNVLANRLQHSEQSESVSNTCLVETDDSNVTLDSPDMCEDDIQNEQNDVESDDERVALANLIANLKLDVDEIKKIQKQLKKANTSLAQELKECKTVLSKTSKSLGESISVRDSCLVSLQTKQTEFEKYKAFNDHTVNYDKFERKLNEALGQIAHKDTVINEGLKTKAYKLSVVKEKHDEFLTKSHYEAALDMEILIQTCLMPLAIKTHGDSLKFVHELKQKMHADLKYVESLEKEINELESEKAEFSDMYDVILHDCVSKDVMCCYLQSLSDLDALAELQRMYLHKVKECDCLAQKLSKQTDSVKNDTVCNEKASNVFRKEREQYFEIQDLKAQMEDKNIAISELKKLIKKGVNHKSNVSRPQLKSNQSRDKVLPNNSQGKAKETRVEVYPRIPSVSNKIKSVTACKDSLNSRTLNANVVSATCNKCLVDSNHLACVTKMLNDIIQLILFIVDSGCTKHMTGNLKLLCNFVEKKSTCFVRDLQGNDLLVSNRGSDLYTISLQESTSSTSLCLMAKATPTHAWLWNQRLSHLNFNYINLLSKKDIVIGLPKLKYVKDQLCSSCELSKAKRSSFKSKVVPSSKGRLNLLHMDLCGLMRFASINGKKYILHQTSTARTPEQNGVVERQNRTLVEAARTMLLASQLPLFFWAEAIVTACYTQNRSIIIPTHDKIPYHIINDRKPSIKQLYIFGRICYITRDGEHLDKMKEKGDQCILMGYSTQSKRYRVYNKRTRMIVESIHIRFDEIKEVSEMSVANNTLGLVRQQQKTSDYDNPDPVPQRQYGYSSADVDVPSQQELDMLFGPLYDEFFNAGSNPSTNIQSTSAPSTHTNVNAEENTMIKQKKENTYQMMNLPILYVLRHKKLLMKVVPTTRRLEMPLPGDCTAIEEMMKKLPLATDLEMCMFSLTMSTVESKNIKEAMADSAWIEAMQEELLKVVPTTRRLEMPLPGDCTAIEEMMKKLPVKDRWQLH